MYGLFSAHDFNNIINLDLSRENLDNFWKLKCQGLTSNKAINTRNRRREINYKWLGINKTNNKNRYFLFLYLVKFHRKSGLQTSREKLKNFLFISKSSYLLCLVTALIFLGRSLYWLVIGSELASSLPQQITLDSILLVSSQKSLTK